MFCLSHTIYDRYRMFCLWHAAQDKFVGTYVLESQWCFFWQNFLNNFGKVSKYRIDLLRWKMNELKNGYQHHSNTACKIVLWWFPLLKYFREKEHTRCHSWGCAMYVAWLIWGTRQQVVSLLEIFQQFWYFSHEVLISHHEV